MGYHFIRHAKFAAQYPGDPNIIQKPQFPVARKVVQLLYDSHRSGVQPAVAVRWECGPSVHFFRYSPFLKIFLSYANRFFTHTFYKSTKNRKLWPAVVSLLNKLPVDAVHECFHINKEIIIDTGEEEMLRKVVGGPLHPGQSLPRDVATKLKLSLLPCTSWNNF